MLARVPLRVEPTFQVTVVKSKYPCVHNIRGIRGITLVGFLLDVSVKVNSEVSPSLGSHMRCCTTESLSEAVKEESPSRTTTDELTYKVNIGSADEVSPSALDSNPVVSYN